MAIFITPTPSAQAEALVEKERSHRVEERLRMVQAIRLERMKQS
jgi:hypothetical protein